MKSPQKLIINGEGERREVQARKTQCELRTISQNSMHALSDRKKIIPKKIKN